jgi:hypothetical protein
MGLFRSKTAASVPSPGEPVRTREELTRIARGQRSGDFMDPGRGPAQEDGRAETVRSDFQ